MAKRTTTNPAPTTETEDATTVGDRRWTAYMPLSEVLRAPRNAKQHAEQEIRASFGEFGTVELPALDDRTGRLVAGHGRLDQWEAMRAAGEQPPGGVDVDPGTGEWLVPVTRGWASTSDTQAEAYLIASNNLTTLGGWDDTALAEHLTQLRDADEHLFEVTGFTDDDLAALLDDAEEDEEELPDVGDPDSVPDAPKHPRTVLGDIWVLGDHWVLCGDSTDLAAVEGMLDGDRADCMWTDPPYGVSYVGKTKDALTISNDGAGDLPDLLSGAFAVATAALKPGAPFYVCHAPGPLAVAVAVAVAQAGWHLRQSLVWVKDALVLGHSDYHYRHEPILYGFTDGGEGRLGRGGDRWYGDNAQVSVFEVAKPPRSVNHPTMKPVNLITSALTNSCPPKGTVYDPFGGSGSTLMAAHITGRIARVVELDPKYVDVICRRFQEATGLLPERVLPDGGTEAVDFSVSDG